MIGLGVRDDGMFTMSLILASYLGLHGVLSVTATDAYIIKYRYQMVVPENLLKLIGKNKLNKMAVFSETLLSYNGKSVFRREHDANEDGYSFVPLQISGNMNNVQQFFHMSTSSEFRNLYEVKKSKNDSLKIDNDKFDFEVSIGLNEYMRIGVPVRNGADCNGKYLFRNNLQSTFTLKYIDEFSEDVVIDIKISDQFRQKWFIFRNNPVTIENNVLFMHADVYKYLISEKKQTLIDEKHIDVDSVLFGKSITRDNLMLAMSVPIPVSTFVTDWINAKRYGITESGQIKYESKILPVRRKTESYVIIFIVVHFILAACLVYFIVRTIRNKREPKTIV